MAGQSRTRGRSRFKSGTQFQFLKAHDMLCFKDRTFCSTDCVNRECSRNLTPDLKRQAVEWWKPSPGEPPIAMADMRCDSYIAPPTTTK